MKERTMSVFKCDHCGKNMLRRHSMVNHEKWCTKNPVNNRVCHGCGHLKEIKFTDYRDGYMGEYEVKCKGFECTKLNIKVYPLSVERRGLTGYSTFDDQEPMKKECEYFKGRW